VAADAGLSRRILYGAMWLAASCALSAAACDTPAGHLIAADSVVEVRATVSSPWVAIRPGHSFCGGDQIAVRGDGRAAVVLSNDVLVRLDRNTTLTLTEVAADRDSRIGLVEGIVHVISRFRKRFGVSTPFVNALVEGTEFTVASDATKSRVSVDEGHVRTVNDGGEQVLGFGESAEAGAGAAPHGIVVRPLDTISWAIHYPQVVWLDDGEIGRIGDASAADIRRARDAAANGRTGEALAALPVVPATQAVQRLVAFRASLLLALGRPDAAQEAIAGLAGSADAAALEAIIAVVRNRNDAALDAARRAVAADANSVSAQLALSYTLQARRQVNEALAPAVRATALTPANPVAWARRAELELSLGQLAAGQTSASRALELAPTMPRARAMLGIAQLLSRDSAAALGTLEAAVASDPADPLAHFGLGLVYVHRNDIERGRREVEIAVLLDPTNAELRSYLGRAYLEEKRSPVAAAEFDLARRLDPASPTPWYFDAFRKLREGDPLGAISDGEEAIARNDNRAVLRPSELLDHDRAARSASLGAAYREIGFKERLAATAMAALADDPASPAAHRLLADAYADTPRYESARLSEQLQSQLRQPIGQWPLPAQYDIAQAPILGGPRNISPEETSILFGAKPFRLAASGMVGTQGSGSTSLAVSRAWDAAQLSFSSFDYRHDVLSDLTPTKLTGNRAEMQFGPGPNHMIYAEIARYDSETGDLTQRLVGAPVDNTYRQQVSTDQTGFGYRWDRSATEQLIIESSFVQRRQHEAATDQFGFFQIDHDFLENTNGRGLSFQYLAQLSPLSMVVGASAFRADFAYLLKFTPSLPSFPPSVSQPAWTARHDTDYIYVHDQLGAYGAIDVGLAFHRFQEENMPSTERLAGKIGMNLNLWSGGKISIAQFETVKGPLLEQRSLEPTAFGGFNQVFDDLDGTRSTRSGLRLEQRFDTTTNAGFELSRRRLDVPNIGCQDQPCFGAWEEDSHQAFAATSWLGRFGASVEWHYETLRLRDSIDLAPVGDIPFRIRTELVPIRFWASISKGITGTIEQIHVRQDAIRMVTDDADNLIAESGSSSFWLTNFRIKWRPEATAPYSIQLAAYNLMNRHFRFQNTDMNNLPRTPLFYPDRTVLLQLDIHF
jgi:tetratricopeptide (TPR) repeat protein